MPLPTFWAFDRRSSSQIEGVIAMTYFLTPWPSSMTYLFVNVTYWNCWPITYVDQVWWWYVKAFMLDKTDRLTDRQTDKRTYQPKNFGKQQTDKRTYLPKIVNFSKQQTNTQGENIITSLTQVIIMMNWKTSSDVSYSRNVMCFIWCYIYKWYLKLPVILIRQYTCSTTGLYQDN